MQEPLLKIDYPPQPHTVRLHFSDPDGLPPGERVFNVMLQGKTVLENFDPAKEGGSVVREFKDIIIGAICASRSSPRQAPKPNPYSAAWSLWQNERVRLVTFAQTVTSSFSLPPWAFL
jgi:hypothetical protein